MTPSLPTRVTMVPDTLFQDMDGETVFLSLASGEYYGVDDVGSRMWQVLEASTDVETAATQLLREFRVDEETLRADLAALIEKMREAGLVTVT